MALPDIEWSTNYPTSQDPDPIGSSGVQDDLTNESAPAADDGNNARVSHWHTMRNKLQEVAKRLGDGSALPPTSALARLKETRRPQLLYATTTTYTIQPAPGASSTVIRVLQDGKAN